MLIQNTTSQEIVLQLGEECKTLPAGATAPYLPNEQSWRDARRYEGLGYIAILEGPDTAQNLASRTLPAYGNFTFSGTAAAGNVCVVKGRTYEFVTSGSAAYGNIAVVAGASATASAANLATAINNDSGSAVTATAVGSVTYLHHRQNGKKGDSVTISAVGANITASGATLTDGVYGSSVGIIITAVEADGGDVVLVTGLASVSTKMVQVTTAAGVVKSYTGTITSVGGVVTASAGVDDIEDGDIVTFFILG